MAFDVVTAKQGKPHVTADQQALIQAGMLGKGRYALDALNNLACTMTDSNTLTVDTGGLMVDGRWVVNEAQTSFAIANGSQAQFRKDLAVLEITVDPSTGVTSLEEKVLQGATAATEAAAADPTYEPGDLYTGLTAVVPIARITLNGLTPTCKALLPSVADLKTISEQTKKLGDSVSRINSAISKSTGWTYLVGSSAGATLTTGYVRYRVNRFNVELDIDYPIADASDKKLSKLIPASLRPYETCWFAICATKRWNKSDHMAYCEVNKDGTVWIGRGGAEAEGRVIGSVSWAIP